MLDEKRCRIVRADGKMIETGGIDLAAPGRVRNHHIEAIALRVIRSGTLKAVTELQVRIRNASQR
jgi:hypothetical protein